MGDLIGLLAEGLKYIMIFCNNITGNYFWLSLLLFTLIIKIILSPFAIKQQKSQQKLAKLRPKEEVIRRKYKDRTDKESQRQMQEEIMAMYKEEKYSQFGGCLPMLVQMPILFSLYYIIQNPLHYICRFSSGQIEAIMDTYNRLTGYASSTAGNLTIKAADFLSDAANRAELINALPVDGTSLVSGQTFEAFKAGLITDIENASYPKFKMFGFIDLSVSPSEKILWYILVPIITFLVLWLTMKLQKKFTYQSVQAESQQTTPTMKIMEFAMPLMSAVFAFSLPVALALYWMYQNLFGLLQQILLSKIFPTHKMTDSEIKDAIREADRQAYEQKKAEEKRKKAVEEEERAIYSATKEGTPEGWVEPMGPVSQPGSSGKGKKNKRIDKVDMQIDDK